MCLKPKKLAELGVRNFCGDFNARNKENFFGNLFFNFYIDEFTLCGQMFFWYTENQGYLKHFSFDMTPNLRKLGC